MAKDKPYYPLAPIASISTLAKTLGVVPKLLVDIASNVSTSYTSFDIESKKGKVRTVYDPKYELKRLQKRINSRIFEKVEFPPYLQGGIKDVNSPRDYVENCKLHVGSSFLISLDIKNFYDNIKVSSVFDIFKYFFKFPDDVCEILTSLVTLNGHVPQGACTSSYVANLVFHNSEYKLVSNFRDRGLTYSRLLDDVTVSSSTLISQEATTEIIRAVAAIFRKHDLRLNSKKTKVERSDDLGADFKVTGLWVSHGQPKLKKDERRYIRQLVYVCEKDYKANPCSEKYHELWNRVSGKVAILTRLKHVEARKLRARLGCVLPLYDDDAKAKICFESKKLLRRHPSTHSKVGVMTAYHKIIHSLGILTRTDRVLARSLRRQLRARYSTLPLKSDIWE
ncbi:reverse transcriptase family protein [Pseudomonas sp. FP597]|uniref:reverse transcriptase family protein n=1 Tax=Pseudomonas sp. FP597 TaxID=2954096 RepID=UPI00273300E4|nr:reverse transcriptase family protein [Pseudomonas sp. FP597]WLI08352.1 reverse transcriptase family protein [Pseudomonas sp. FP597]